MKRLAVCAALLVFSWAFCGFAVYGAVQFYLNHIIR